MDEEIRTETEQIEETKEEEVRTEELHKEDQQEEKTTPRRVVRFRDFAAGFMSCIAILTVLTFGFGLGRFMSKGDWDYYHDLDKNYGKYAEIMKMIGDDPLSKEVPEKISDDILKEIVAATEDPYAEYFTAEEYAEFEKKYVGGYVGIGIGVVEEDGKIIIKTVYDGGPAAKAGIQEEDIILEVDGVVPSDVSDAVNRMTGEEDTEVTVTVSRNGERRDFTMIRKEINLESVGYAVREEDPEVGYIRISIFRKGTDDEFKDAVKALKEKGCDKFILDLRDNGGGLTDVSIEIADYLLPACVIMTDVTKSGSETVYNSDENSADLDMVVLVNGNTASASEILTGAIKENNAGTVIGSKTYGKGVTQMSRRFGDGSAVKLTVSEYLTPKRNHVNENGIEPDVKATDEEIFDKALEELNK